MRTLLISEDTLNAITSYLGTQPYRHVRPLFDKISEDLRSLRPEKPPEEKQEVKAD
jgi:hypothetical protein